jgi:hypothetical protein
MSKYWKLHLLFVIITLSTFLIWKVTEVMFVADYIESIVPLSTESVSYLEREIVVITQPPSFMGSVESVVIMISTLFNIFIGYIQLRDRRKKNLENK